MSSCVDNVQSFYFFGGYNPACKVDASLCTSIFYLEFPMYPLKYHIDPSYNALTDKIKIHQIKFISPKPPVLGAKISYVSGTKTFMLFGGYSEGNLVY